MERNLWQSNPAVSLVHRHDSSGFRTRSDISSSNTNATVHLFLPRHSTSPIHLSQSRRSFILDVRQQRLHSSHDDEYGTFSTRCRSVRSEQQTAVESWTDRVHVAADTEMDQRERTRGREGRENEWSSCCRCILLLFFCSSTSFRSDRSSWSHLFSYSSSLRSEARRTVLTLTVPFRANHVDETERDADWRDGNSVGIRHGERLKCTHNDEQNQST